ncbi:SDR family NAD(P)-dependent oxidoreductase [Actinomadura harenae]|uniref:SDR family NAD(P)-dependent oxidoreductase n=1 Tax=Actinomadura harenae TaxID=2483351 RepID=A0A3M2LTR4_9ACTN|nr:SDR family NAD(P)-dependent oxidoreductase [Actinomadura harenae]RMI40506.1 SDR family NAD(P)-dependent oxidoreductase [Actinomadura harenae]
MNTESGWADGQVVLITGGGSGLGRALVDAFLAEGAEGVVVLERRPEKVKALRESFGSDAVRVVEGDVRSSSDNREAVAAAVDGWGRLDCFIANAGIWDCRTMLDDLSEDAIPDAFDEIFAVNVKAPLLGAKAAMGALRATRGSFLVSLSGSSLFPGAAGPLYVASKHAGAGLVLQLAWEYAPDVRVNGVALGGMPTDIRGPRALGLQDATWDPAQMDEVMRKRSPLARSPRPQDYCGAYLMLASRHYGLTTTGTVLDLSGGMSIATRVSDF